MQKEIGKSRIGAVVKRSKWANSLRVFPCCAMLTHLRAGEWALVARDGMEAREMARVYRWLMPRKRFKVRTVSESVCRVTRVS